MRRAVGRIQFGPIQRGSRAVISDGNVIPSTCDKSVRTAAGNRARNCLAAGDELKLQGGAGDAELKAAAAGGAVGADDFLVHVQDGGLDESLNRKWCLSSGANV